jgi:hypothetical protein
MIQIACEIASGMMQRRMLWLASTIASGSQRYGGVSARRSVLGPSANVSRQVRSGP